MRLEAPRLKKNFVTSVEKIVGPDSLSSRPLDRINYSRDSNFKSVIRNQYGHRDPPPDLIVWPEKVEQIQQLVQLAGRHKISIVPYGAGSGVCGGAMPIFGGMIIDLKKMRRLKVDADNLSAVADAGMMGMHLENELQRKGFTLGHFPSSIVCAGLGGYLAARSAGQTSSRYGKIEDMVQSLQMVSGRGDIIDTRDVANREGIDFNQMFLGSEGTLGILTQATLRIYPTPPAQAFRGIRFNNLKSGLEAIRRIMQSGLKPAVIRLYDVLDTLLFLSHGKKGKKTSLPVFLESLADLLYGQSVKAALQVPKILSMASRLVSSGCLLVLMHEGHERLVAEEQKTVLSICKNLGGEDLGEEPGRAWHEHRYSVSYKASALFYSGAFTDTIEVATTWDKLYPLYAEMKKAMASHALVLAHISHAYTEGASIYFTFVAPLQGLRRAEKLYDLIWDRAMKSCQKVGGIISHHHGVGRLKAKYMKNEWGEGLGLYHLFKNHFDPNGIMNPGKLVSDAA